MHVTPALAALVLAAAAGPSNKSQTVVAWLPPPGAPRATVDEVATALADLARVAPLDVAPGKHEVYAVHVGFDSETVPVDLAFEGNADVTIELHPWTKASTSGAAPNAPTLPVPDAPAVARESGDNKVVRVAVYD